MQHWFRVDTAYDDSAGTLTIQHTPKHACVRYAYFAPYSWERHAELIMRMQVGASLAGWLAGWLPQAPKAHDVELVHVCTPLFESRQGIEQCHSTPARPSAKSAHK
jgi:murein tripeptide amidase MpaA